MRVVWPIFAIQFSSVLRASRPTEAGSEHAADVQRRAPASTVAAVGLAAAVQDAGLDPKLVVEDAAFAMRGATYSFNRVGKRWFRTRGLV